MGSLRSGDGSLFGHRRLDADAFGYHPFVQYQQLPKRHARERRGAVNGA